MKDVATAFPLSRTLDVKNGDKTSVSKLFETSDNSYATTNLSSGSIRIDPKNGQEGTADAGRGRHLQRQDARAGSWWWAVPCGRATVSSASTATATCS